MRHPVKPEDIPSYGVDFQEGNSWYRVGINHNTGEVKVMDLTTVDPATGAVIDPSMLEQSELDLWVAAVIGGTKEALTSDIPNLAILIIGGLVIFWIVKEWKR